MEPPASLGIRWRERRMSRYDQEPGLARYLKTILHYPLLTEEAEQALIARRSCR